METTLAIVGGLVAILFGALHYSALARLTRLEDRVATHHEVDHRALAEDIGALKAEARRRQDKEGG